MILDFRFFEALAELSSLRDLLITIDDQETHLTELRWEELLKQIERYGDEADDDEWDIARQQHQYQTEFLYPKAFRGAFIISLWATFEATLNEIAKFIQTKKGMELKLSDIRGANIIDQIKKYFNHVLSFDLEITGDVWVKIDDLYFLRNVYAHTNGRLDMLKDNEKNRLSNILKKNSDFVEINGYLVVDKMYLYEAFNFLDTELQRIINKVRIWHDSMKA